MSSISGSARTPAFSNRRYSISSKCAALCYCFLQWAVRASSSGTGSSSITVNNEAVWRVPLLSARHVYERKLEEQNRRRMSSGEEALPMSQLYQGYGTHYVDLWVGSPIPQRQTVIVDTGSSVTAFPCKGCHECGFDDNAEYHTDTYFDPSLSETFQTLSCDNCRIGQCNPSNECSIGMSYAEGSSWNAYEAMDYVYAGGSHTEPITPLDPKATSKNTTEASRFLMKQRFGCQTSLTGLFRTQLADGIMGMVNEGNSFWSQMYQNGIVSKKQFSLCFSRHDYVDPKGTLAGTMTIGGYDERIHTKPMVFAKEVSGGSGFYTVRLKNIYLKESSSNKDMIPVSVGEYDLNSYGVIVDSGTTDTYFMSVIRDPFQNAWKEVTGKPYSNEGIKFSSKEDLLSLPTVVLRLEGTSRELYENIYGSIPSTSMLIGEDSDPDSPMDVLVHIPPWHYMEYDSESDQYTPRFYMDEGSGTVLGANTMQGHDVFFDMENGLIGFAESDCKMNLEHYPSGSTESSKAQIDDFVAELDDEFLKEPEKDDEETLLASWSCATPECRRYFSLTTFVLVVGGIVVVVALYSRNTGNYNNQGRMIPVQSRDLEFFDEDGDVEITSASSIRRII